MNTFCVVGLAWLAWMTQISAGQELAWRVSYDQLGRIAARTDPAGRTTTYSYRPANDSPAKVITIAPPEGQPIIWRFAADGRLAAMTDGEGTIEYHYDAEEGRLASVDRRGGHPIRYSYDEAGRLATLEIGTFYRIAWTYDFLDRLVRLETPAGPVNYDYQSGQGQVVRSLPNGVKTFWKRQPNGQLETITHGVFASPKAKSYAVLAHYAYHHDPSGRIVAIEEESPQGQAASRYTYDNMGRLTAASGAHGGQERYVYDLDGNRIKATASGRADQSSSFDWAGRLTSVDGQSCAYDGCGNLTQITVDGMLRQYRYHADGRLAEAKVGDHLVTYRYDGFGRLVARASGAGETRFVADPLSPYWQPMVIDEQGGARTLVIWDGPTPLAWIRNGKVEWLLHDHLGSVRLVTDDQGKVRRTLSYEAFGGLLGEEGAASIEPAFSGLLLDRATGGYLTLARVAVPELGRFLQPDTRKPSPFGLPFRSCLYAYCASDPINMVDLDGATPVQIDEHRLWWDAYWRDVRQNVLNAARAKETLAIYSASHLELARGSGVAAATTASLLDIVGGYIPGPAANEGQSYAQLMWSASIGGGGLVLKAAAPLFSGLGLGLNAGATVIHTAEGRPDSALLNVVSLNLRLHHDYGKAALGKAFPPGYQHQLPFTPESIRQATTFAQLSTAVKQASTVMDTYSWGKITHSAAEHITRWSPRPVAEKDRLSPSPVGGVYLGGAGGALVGLGTVAGLQVDGNGNLLLVGEESDEIKLPALRVDDLATVFRSVYLHGEGPSVTIDPNPDDPEKSAMIIRHGQGTEDTYVGWVLYQADRIMKGYGQGQDNVTGQEIASQVPGYGRILEAIYFGADDPRQRQRGGVWERFWIVPAAARRFVGPQRQLTLVDVPLKVMTQKMKWQNGKLVDDPHGQSSPGATAFSSWFTDNYDGISAEQYLLPPPESGLTSPVPVFAELRRIALMTALAEKLRDDGVPLPFWMRDHEVGKVPFERTTPGLEVTWRRQRGKIEETARLFGGVTLSPESRAVSTYSTAAEAARAPAPLRNSASQGVKLAADLEQTVARTLPLTSRLPLTVHSLSQADRVFQAAVVPGADTQALRSCRLAEVDIAIPVAGGDDLRLVRSYNSFFDPNGPWGRGWALDLPRLVRVKVPTNRQTNAATYQIGYDLATPLNRQQARFREVRPVAELAGAILQVPERATPFWGVGDDRPKFLAGTATQVVYLKNGQEWHFSENGDLVAEVASPQITVYERDGDGRLSRLVAVRGGALAARIDLAYNLQGQIAKAVGVALDAPSAKPVEVAYSYADSGRLAGLATSSGTIGYQYDGSLLTEVSTRENRADATLVPLMTFEYSDHGLLLVEKRAGVATSYSTVADSSGLAAMAVDNGGAPTIARYDASMRPLQAVTDDGTTTEWKYQPDGAVEIAIGRPDGSQITIADSADGRRRQIHDGQSPALTLDYDPGGRLLRAVAGNRELLAQEWHADGQLARLRTASQGISYQYDAHRLLTSLIAHPPSPGETMREWQETRVDRFGKPVEIRDQAGLHMQMVYDNRGALAAQVQQTAEGSFGFNLERDEAGRVLAVKSSWGDTTYSYAANGDLERLASRRGPATATVDLPGGVVQRITAFDGGVTTFDYDDARRPGSHLRTITCPNGLKLRHEYDQDERLAAVTLGTNRRLELTYDTAGRVVAYAWEPIRP